MKHFDHPNDNKSSHYKHQLDSQNFAYGSIVDPITKIINTVFIVHPLLVVELSRNGIFVDSIQ